MCLKKLQFFKIENPLAFFRIQSNVPLVLIKYFLPPISRNNALSGPPYMGFACHFCTIFPTDGLWNSVVKVLKKCK